MGNTWKMAILWRLNQRSMRFSELKNDIPRITDKMLSAKLRVLEEEGFILKTLISVTTSKVEYRITKRGKKSVEMINLLRDYGKQLMKEFNIKHKEKK